MQIEYGCTPFIVLAVLLGVAFFGIHLIRGKSDGNDSFGQENWGKVLLGFCVCAAVPLTMDSVVTFSPENITINFWAWGY